MRTRVAEEAVLGRALHGPASPNVAPRGHVPFPFFVLPNPPPSRWTALVPRWEREHLTSWRGSFPPLTQHEHEDREEDDPGGRKDQD